MMPPTAQLEAAFGRHGLSAGSRVVLYSIGSMMWATRFWWMLRALGLDRAAVLDGGLDKWKAEGRPTESGPAKGYPAATFRADPRPGLFVGREAVLAALGDRERRHRQRAGAPVPQRPGAEPLRQAGAHPRQRQRPGGEPRRPRDQGLHHAWRCRGEAHGARGDEGQGRDLLLRRRHLRHPGPLPAAPARLRQAEALRRLHGRVGEGRCLADRDRLTPQPPDSTPSVKASNHARARRFDGPPQPILRIVERDLAAQRACHHLRDDDVAESLLARAGSPAGRCSRASSCGSAASPLPPRRGAPTRWRLGPPAPTARRTWRRWWRAR